MNDACYNAFRNFSASLELCLQALHVPPRPNGGPLPTICSLPQRAKRWRARVTEETGDEVKCESLSDYGDLSRCTRRALHHDS